MRIFLSAVLLLCPLLASAQLAVTVSPVKVTGQKAIVPLALKNNFAEKIESARATVFQFDEQGKVVGQSAQWVIGGTKERPALDPAKETIFNFIVPADKAFTKTKVTFNRLILEGGKSVNVNQNVQIEQ